MKKYLGSFLVIISTIGLFPSSFAGGGVPRLINYQGKLTDGVGAPVNLETEITFSIYSEPSGDGTLWSETQTVWVVEGIFNVLLGCVNPLSPDYFSGHSQTYLGLKVAADSEMFPRQEITSVAYALKTEGINVKDGNVGIGTEDPGFQLEVAGDIKVGGDVIIPNLPAFSAYKSGGRITFAAGDHIFDTAEFNNGNHYNTVNGRFTAPITGIYFFKVQFFLHTSYGNNTNNYIGIVKNGERVRTTNIGHADYDGGLKVSAVLKLDAGDYVNSSANLIIDTWGGEFNSFSGFLVSGL